MIKRNSHQDFKVLLSMFMITDSCLDSIVMLELKHAKVDLEATASKELMQILMPNGG
jgi:hypothetical protein